MTELIEEIREGVAVVTLNRPDRANALSAEMLDRLPEVLKRLAASEEVGAVVLTGAGRAFCAGGDMKSAAQEGGEERALAESRVQRLRRRMEASRLLHEMRKPTIAAMPGAAAGAGLALALACDFRIAARGAKLTTAFAKVGLSGDFGGSYFLSRLVGPAKARKMYYLPEVILAEEAERLGIVDSVVEPQRLHEFAFELGCRLASGPRVALEMMKANFNLAETAGLGECLDAEAERHSFCSTTSDHKEGARAFVEGRAPIFRGL